jgi:hypothetical protein
LTSGKEQRTQVPFEASGKLRHEERVQWWKEYDAAPFCVFGHYAAFGGETSPSFRAVCIDFAVASRWQERKALSFDGQYRGKLAAARFPEQVIVFDDGNAKAIGNGKLE